eukprot:5908934-Pleurochrysis_carterae.AAC.2
MPLVDVTLLSRRQPFERLDVAPFALLYPLTLAALPSSYAVVAIPLVLCMHIIVFLATQWSVAVSAQLDFRMVALSYSVSHVAPATHMAELADFNSFSHMKRDLRT